MGNKQSCCIYHSPKSHGKKTAENYQPSRSEVEVQGQHLGELGHGLQQQQSNISLSVVPQHISEREPEGKRHHDDCLLSICHEDMNTLNLVSRLGLSRVLM